ncbi:MAG: PAS domain S-box protein [Bacteroidetes bacterium]|nr:PAS domain S-box protein [Bacteroidota bacterium]
MSSGKKGGRIVSHSSTSTLSYNIEIKGEDGRKYSATAYFTNTEFDHVEYRNFDEPYTRIQWKILTMIDEWIESIEQGNITTEPVEEQSKVVDEAISDPKPDPRFPTPFDNPARNQLELFQQSIELLPDAIVAIDQNGIIKFHNQLASTLFGYKDKGITGKEIQSLLPKSVRKKYSERIKYFFKPDNKRKEARGIPLKGLRRDGRVIDLDIDLSLLSINDSTIGLAVIRDISRKVEFERKLLEQNKHLETINAKLEQFSHIIIHDLKAPLDRVSGLTKLILAELPAKKSKEVSSYVGYLNESLNSMQDLMYGVLDYSKADIESENEEKIDLQEIFEEIIKLLTIPANFTLDIDPNLPVIKGHKTRVLQLFMNLITNSIKYNDKPDGMIKVDYKDEGNFWEFRVMDNGPGIPIRSRKKVFDLFETGRNGKNGKSHGVGLAIAKNIVEDKGGKIWISSSEPDQLSKTGISFKFNWPKD